jgi:hypothetical protein
MQKTQEKKFVSVFRIKLIRILISADLVLQPWWVQTFFLRKYLILLHFLILKTPIEDSILCHKPDFIHYFLTRRAFACLLNNHMQSTSKTILIISHVKYRIYMNWEITQLKILNKTRLFKSRKYLKNPLILLQARH